MTSAPSRQSLPPGYRLGAYRIAEVLSDDALGYRYRAIDTLLELEVEIREYVPAALARRTNSSAVAAVDGGREAFDTGLKAVLEESRALGLVRNPAIVGARALIEANATVYVVRDLSRGTALSALFPGARAAELNDVAAIMMPTLQGLAEAHAAGAVHGALSPDSILVEAGGRVLVTGFARARWAMAVGDGSWRELLSPGYASPEHHRGEAGLNARADVYAAGAILYRLISGKTPPAAPDRLKKDRLQPAVRVGQGRYPWHLLSAVDTALALDLEARANSLRPLYEALAPAALAAGPVVTTAAAPGAGAAPVFTAPGVAVGTGAGAVAAAPPAATAAAPSGKPCTPMPPSAALREAVAASAAGNAKRARWSPWHSVVAVAIALALGALGWMLWQEIRPTEPEESQIAALSEPEAPEEGVAGGAAPGDAETAAAVVPAEPEAAPEPEPEPEESAEAEPEATPDPEPEAAPEPEPEAAPEPQVAAVPEPAAADEQQAPDESADALRDCDDCPALSRVPEGGFWMGAVPSEAGYEADEGPVRYVEIAKPFFIMERELTVSEWMACVDAGVCDPPGQTEWEPAPEMPVVGVSWEEAETFAAWLSEKTGQRYRLPTEAEWEYAARAGSATRYPWGDEVGVGSAQCVDCQGGPPFKPVPVGSFAENAYGLRDMVGNVGEWVEDCYAPSYRDAPSDGSAVDSANCDERVIRGGAFNFLSEALRSANRDSSKPNLRSPYTGFRLVREVAS